MAQKETFLMFNKKIIIPLLIVIALLLVLLAVSMTGTNNTDELVPSSSEYEDYTVNYILDFDTESVSQISVSIPEEDFSFKKNEDRWYLAGKESASISSASVNSLISSLADFSYDEFIDDGSISAADCGIDDSAPKISFLSDLGEVTLKMGMVTNDGSLCYVMTSLSDGIYLADYETASKIFAPLKVYRNSASINLDFDNITKIRYSGSEKLSLEKGSSDKNNVQFNSWKITSPISISANDEFVANKIIEPLKQIKIVDFASDNGDFANYGLAGKETYVSLTDASGKEKTLYFSKQVSGKYYISIEDGKTIYEVSLSDSPYLALKIIDLADRNISLAKMDNIKHVTIKGTLYDYKVEFLDKKGSINGSEISYDVLNQNIFPALCGLMADDIYTGSMSQPEITMTFTYKSSSPDTIIFASYNDRYYSVSKNGLVKYLILKNKISSLAKTLDQYK